MNRDRWRQIEELYNTARPLGVAERERLLAVSCAGDEELRLEVESLLEEPEGEDDFLSEPVFAAGLSLLAPARPEPITAGSLVGHYRVIRELGRGGMGEVYLAEDTRLGRRVSLKLLSAPLAAGVGVAALLEREARAASGVSHRGVAHVYDFGEAGGRHYLAMEYVEGTSLREVLLHESLAVSEAVGLACQVAEALAAAHERGGVHCDVKPENIVVTQKGEAKVLDFGLARVHVVGEPTEGTEAPRVMGTDAYMSPEQAQGLEADARTDVWSLGVVRYEMVARRRPFEGETDTELLDAVLNAEPPAVRFGGRGHEGLDRVLKKALANDKAARYPSAAEFAQDLRALKRELDAGEAAESDGPGGSPRDEVARAATRRGGFASRLRVPVLVALLLAFVAVALYFFVSRDASRPQDGGRPGAAVEERIGSLVIVPLANTGGGGDDLSYLSEGVAEDLIRSLGTSGKARVIALSSARKIMGRERDFAWVRGALGVDFLLGGSVGEGDGSLKVEVYLVDLKRGERVWEENYISPSRELLNVRNALFVLLSNRLQAALSGDKHLPLPPASTLNAEAYLAYLRGAYARDRQATEGLKRAVSSLERAVELDPGFALAWSALGDGYNLLGSFMGGSPEVYLPKARAASICSRSVSTRSSTRCATTRVFRRSKPATSSRPPRGPACETFRLFLSYRSERIFGAGPVRGEVKKFTGVDSSRGRLARK